MRLRTVKIHYDVREIIEDFKQNAEIRGIKLEIKHLDDVPSMDSVQEYTKRVSDKQ